MTQLNTLELAKQGDARAIASLLNHQLQPKGITAKAVFKDGCLQVMLESAQVPDRQTLVAFIRKGIASLGNTPIERMKIYGRQTGEEIPAWNQEFGLAEQPLPLPNLTVTESTIIHPASQPQPLSLKERAKQGDTEAITKLLNYAFQHKNITAKASSKDSCLQVMLESAQVPDEESSVRIIRRELTNLKLESLKGIKIYGREISEELPAWQQQIVLVSPSKLGSSQIDILTPKASERSQLTVKAISKAPQTITVYTKHFFNNNFKFKALLASSILLVTLGLAGLITWARTGQEQTIAKVQNLIANVADSESNSKLDTLKNLQQQLQEASATLEKISNFPGSLYQKAQDDLGKVRARIDALEHKIKILEQLQPEAKVLVEQFSALNSRLDVGMNYQTYSDQVRELKVALDRFALLPEASSNPVYKNLEKAFKEYDFALDVWKDYIDSDEKHSFFPASSYYGNKLIQDYEVETQDIGGTEYIYLNTALSKIWSRAGEHIKTSHAQI